MIIVTGGAGFIGSNLIALLERSGVHDIVVCDNVGAGDKWRNLGKRELADFIEPDYLLDYLDNHANDVEMIFHMGAISSTIERDVDLIVRNNFHLDVQLWNWCVRHDTRFIYASSAATYGDGSNGFSDSDSPEELAKLQPLNAYGWSKHLFDRRVARLVKNGEAAPPQWAGLKFFNVYGPNEYHKEGQLSVAYQVWQAIEAGEPARLFKSYRDDYADGAQRRDFVWVGTCAAIMKWLYERPDVSGLFNVGTGQARSFEDLARAVFAAMGRAPQIEYIEMPEWMRDKYQYLTEAKMDKLREAGFAAPFTSLEEGITRYVQDFLSQPDRYR
jgi:ADP-L-glycero-D-manno-heptose 6-epimerase